MPNANHLQVSGQRPDSCLSAGKMGAEPTREGSTVVSPFDLFVLFFRISAVTLGGGIAILAMARTELERRGLPEEDLEEIATLSTSMPGPIATSSAWLAGRKVAGIRGAIAAVAGVLIPPFSAILLLSGFVLAHQDSPRMAAFFKGVLCAVAALVANLVWGEIRRSLTVRGRRLNILPYGLVVGLILFLGLHPLIAMACGVALKLVLPEENRWTC